MLKKSLRLGWKISSRIILGILVFIGSYFLLAGICFCIPVNADFVAPVNGITIAVVSNGIHADICVPDKNEIYDWTKIIPYSHVKIADSSFHYISFGWGDKGFYIGTPKWSDLKAGTAIKAMFWMSTSAMHVTWRKKVPVPGFHCRVITITKEKYAALCQYILETFKTGNDNRPEHISAPSYGEHDAFYEAKGTYNLFKTCNVWTGNGLKIAGISVAIWTPFERCLFSQLPE
jgi:uncharacterized protein (TIGR02117 family)